MTTETDLAGGTMMSKTDNKKQALFENLQISARVLLRYYDFGGVSCQMPVHAAFGDLARALSNIEEEGGLK